VQVVRKTNRRFITMAKMTVSSTKTERESSPKLPCSMIPSSPALLSLAHRLITSSISGSPIIFHAFYQLGAPPIADPQPLQVDASAPATALITSFLALCSCSWHPRPDLVSMYTFPDIAGLKRRLSGTRRLQGRIIRRSWNRDRVEGRRGPCWRRESKIVCVCADMKKHRVGSRREELRTYDNVWIRSAHRAC